LLNLLGAIDRPTAGIVRIRGRDVSTMRDREATQFRLRNVGLVFQRFYLMPTLSARENIELPMAEAGAGKTERTARARELASTQIISRQQLDAAQAAALAANANLIAAERQASAASAGVSTAQAGVRMASARALSAKAIRDNTQLQLSYTRITAPASGIVAKKQVEVGQLVAAGQPLLNIVADTGVWVTANFKETQRAKSRPGKKAEFDVDAYGWCAGTGVVESVSGATGAKFALLPPDNATGNFTKVVQRVPVRIRVIQGCSGNRPLRPGLSVTVHVDTKGKQ